MIKKTVIDSTLPLLGEELKQTLLEKTNRIFNSERISAMKIPDKKAFEKETVKSFFFSAYIESNLTKNPEILKGLIESQDLFKPLAHDTLFKTINSMADPSLPESEIQKVICKRKLREIIRIAWRDLNQRAELNETLNDLSLLADACIEAASRYIYDKLSSNHGYPLDKNGRKQKLIILGMGKLGARELNYSSDIDLIFAYSDKGCTDGERSISNEEFFTKMSRKFINLLSTHVDGVNFYRVDTRLRPFGATGPLVMSSRELEEYYQAQGREWERYALIKARPVAGDIKGGQRLLHDLNAFIYRRYFDYGTFDSFKEMKNRISLQVKNKNMQDNIKLGPGGIREIEFFGQIFQLIRGGVEPELQERKILTVLDKLVQYSCIDDKTKNDLSDAYIFLRRVENRLQEYEDLQTHDLPNDNEDRLRLALSMNFASFEAFTDTLEMHRKKVQMHFKELLSSEDDETDDNEMQKFKHLWLNINDAQSLIETEKISEYDDIENVIKQLRLLEEHPKTKKLATSGRKRLNRLMPLVLQQVSRSKDQNTVLMRLIELIISIESRACYISLLLENKGALNTLAVLAEKSPWIIAFLSRHPTLLDELLDTKTLYSPPEKEELEKLLKQRTSKIPIDDIEFLLEELSVFKQTNTLRVAATDISNNFPLMKVSDRLTYIAETILDKVLEIAWNIVVEKYGRPEGVSLDDMHSCGFAIVSYGKVGGLETGYKSDIDLIFICSENSGITKGGKKDLENIAFYSILSQRIISALTMHTAAGQLYGADMRLRPGGQSGPIVTQINALAEYFKNEAWTWEHQALIRARPVSGDKKIQGQFNEIRKKIISQKRDPDVLKKEVIDMRERMRKEHDKSSEGLFNIKQGKGGIIDIEFLVQYLVLKSSHSHPDLELWTDNIRLLESLAKEKIILQQECDDLQEAYVVMRKAIHRRNLQEKGINVPEDHFEKLKSNVISINKKYL